jgi:RNA polymerase sigma factor (TIGR02999 family)
MPLVYAELRSMAAAYLRRERVDHTLQPTALVHEAFLRLSPGDKSVDRAHFMALAAVAMRNVLVDHARKHTAAKRSADGKRLTLGAPELATDGSALDVLELDDLLHRLAKLDARRARVVELKVFAAMTNDEIAHVLGISRSTVAEDWTVAKAWLAAELTDR